MATVNTAMTTERAARVAQEFPIVGQYTYLNAAAQGPWPDRTFRAVERAARLSQFPGTDRAREEPTAETAGGHARAALARLIGAGEDDFVWTANTTQGMNICAQGIAWRPGDNVVVPERDYPALSYAFFHLRERGVEVRFVPYAGVGPTVDEIMAATDRRTRAIALSAIRWDTGWRMDLEGLGRACAAHGCLFIVDGVQAVAAQRLDVRAMKISALSVHAYKWLMAGFGIGALYVAPDAVEQIRPTFVANNSIAGNPEAFAGALDWKPGAQRYAAGGGNRVGLHALAASLSLIEEIGIDTIEAHNRALAAYLCDGLAKNPHLTVVSAADPAHRSAITVFTTGTKDGDAAPVQSLDTQGINVALRPLGVRVSPHLYNSEADIARFLAALPGK